VLDVVGEGGQPASQAELQTHEWAINAEQALCSARHAGMSQGELNDHSNRRGSRNAIGGQSCATSLRPQVHRIIDGRHQTAASSHQDSTSYRWSVGALGHRDRGRHFRLYRN
jgi:hypothetical protein